jgi:matrixin
MGMKMYVASAAAIALMGLLPIGSSDDDPTAMLLCANAPEGAHDATETIPWPTVEDPGMTLTTHAICFSDAVNVNLDTDCTATAYTLTGWYWPAPYNAQVDPTNGYGFTSAQVVSTFNSGANTWDNAVAADIFGSFVAGGSASKVRTQDFINQHGWKMLGGGGTIAVTYTWAYADHRAAESDAAYNTFYGWSLSGAAGKMDLLNINTHELGHTFGMGHSPTGGANSCLTMYPTGSYGETQKRTLGDGDILGIDARY